MTNIGICGPIFIPQLEKHLYSRQRMDVKGMGGTPVNHQIEALLDRGYNVSVFSLTPELLPKESLELNGKNLQIFVGPFRRRARQRCPDLFWSERKFLKKSILDIKPDIIHAHWQYEWAWAAIDSKIPTLVTCHDSPLSVLKQEKDLYRLVRLFMAAIVLSKAKHLTAVSPYTASSLRLFTKREISIIPNFESNEVFQNYKAGNLKLKDGKAFKVAMVNNGFCGLKNVATGIRGFMAFQKYFPGAELHLYGHCNGVGEEAQHWCQANGFKTGIYFHGPMPFKTLIESFSDANILLHTSLEESCSMVVIEAFAMGIPVIGGNKSGGMPWMIEKGCGYLVDVRDKTSIRNALIKLSDTERNLKFSENARALALKRFSRDAVLNKYIQLYEEIL